MKDKKPILLLESAGSINVFMKLQKFKTTSYRVIYANNGIILLSQTSFLKSWVFLVCYIGHESVVII